MKYTFNESNGGHTYWVISLASLENGYLASGSVDSTVKIWDQSNTDLIGHTDLIYSLASLENGYLAKGHGIKK